MNSIKVTITHSNFEVVNKKLESTQVPTITGSFITTAGKLEQQLFPPHWSDEDILEYLEFRYNSKFEII